MRWFVFGSENGLHHESLCREKFDQIPRRQFSTFPQLFYGRPQTGELSEQNFVAFEHADSASFFFVSSAMQDEDKIKDKVMTENVASMLVNKLRRFQTTAQHVIKASPYNILYILFALS